jgi:hypothetical protein
MEYQNNGIPERWGVEAFPVLTHHSNTPGLQYLAARPPSQEGCHEQ